MIKRRPTPIATKAGPTLDDFYNLLFVVSVIGAIYALCVLVFSRPMPTLQPTSSLPLVQILPPGLNIFNPGAQCKDIGGQIDHWQVIRAVCDRHLSYNCQGVLWTTEAIKWLVEMPIPSRTHRSVIVHDLSFDVLWDYVKCRRADALIIVDVNAATGLEVIYGTPCGC